MSMHQLIRFHPQSPFPSDQKRCVHRSSDYRYMHIWNRSKVHFQQYYKNIYSYPLLVDQILRTSSASKMKGFVPFVHAVPASMSVVRKVWERIAQERGLEHRKNMIRSPLSVYARTGYKQAVGDIPKQEIQSGKPGILSMSYALTSGSRNLETAASWGFCNHMKDEQYFPFIEELRASLKELGISDDSYFAKKGRYLISQYAQLEVGDFLTIHLTPNLVRQYVYDSYPYNIPTGKEAIDVAENPEAHLENLLGNSHTHMASLVLCKEVLGPDSEVLITDTHNLSEVDTFCQGMEIGKMCEIEVFDGLVSQVPTFTEEVHRSKRKALDEDLELYADELKAFLATYDRKWNKSFTLTPVYRGLLCMV